MSKYLFKKPFFK